MKKTGAAKSKISPLLFLYDKFNLLSLLYNPYRPARRTVADI